MEANVCVHDAYFSSITIVIISEHYNSVTNEFDVQMTVHRNKFL